MTVKDLVSTHRGVIDKHENRKITVSVYTDDNEYSPELSADEAIKKHGIKTVKEWFQIGEITDNGILIDICILIEEGDGNDD